jgi:hypothetical protein
MSGRLTLGRRGDSTKDSLLNNPNPTIFQGVPTIQFQKTFLYQLYFMLQEDIFAVNPKIAKSLFSEVTFF